jgi:hypothetical protein
MYLYDRGINFFPFYDFSFDIRTFSKISQQPENCENRNANLPSQIEQVQDKNMFSTTVLKFKMKRRSYTWHLPRSYHT